MVTELLQSMFVQNLFHFVDIRIDKQPFVRHYITMMSVNIK